MTDDFDDEDPLVNRNKAADIERIKQARKRRAAQLKSWHQYDKLMERNRTRASGRAVKSKTKSRNVHFDASIILLEAAIREDYEEVKRILSEGGCPDACNEDGLTALHQACIDNSLIMCQILLQFNANVNATDSEMWTPLHAAAACAHIEICGCLIDNGANLLALNAEGNMPYDICEDENTLDLIENAMAMRGVTQEQIDEQRHIPELKMLNDVHQYYNDKGDLEAFDNQGATLLHIAASCGYMEVGRFLLDHGVNVQIMDRDGWQSIHVAACWGQLEFIELLLMRGADIDSVTTSGESVYEICEDIEMNRRLQQIKEELDRKYKLKKSLEIKPSNASNIGKRSNSSKRSASIRRSSMREKSLMSWKEARQEALIREVVQQKIKDSPQSSTNDTEYEPHKQAKLAEISQSKSNKENINGYEKDDEIDLNQVILDVQVATENELSTRGLVRRGSSRNSFKHSHPYHSPSRDPSLLDQVVPEEDDTPDLPIAKPRTNKKHPPPNNNNEKSSIDGSLRDPKNFIRNCNPNASVIRTNEQLKTNRPSNSSIELNNNSNNNINNNPTQHKKKKREIDSKDGTLKQNKVQGCCSVM